MFQFAHPDPATLMPAPTGAALFAAPPGQGNLPPRFAAGPLASPYPVDFERTAIAVGYANTEYIADRVLPRLAPLARKEYRYNLYPIEEHYTVPPTLVARRSAPAMVHLSASEATRSIEDYGLDDAIPVEAVQNTPSSAMNPIDRSSMVLSDLLMVAREKRVATLVFDDASYPAGNKATLSGNARRGWKDPSLFVALATRPEVAARSFGGHYTDPRVRNCRYHRLGGRGRWLSAHPRRTRPRHNPRKVHRQGTRSHGTEPSPVSSTSRCPGSRGGRARTATSGLQSSATTPTIRFTRVRPPACWTN